MKKTFFSMPNALLLHALTTFLVGIGCTYPLSLSLGLTAPLSLSVGCCALVTLAFALLSCLPRLRALAYPLLLAVLCAFVFSLRGEMNAISARADPSFKRACACARGVFPCACRAVFARFYRCRRGSFPK